MTLKDIAKGAKIAATVIGTVLTLLTASAEALETLTEAVNGGESFPLRLSGHPCRIVLK